MTSSNSTLHTISSVADVAGVSRQTLHAWLKAGWVKHRYARGGTPVFTLKEVEKVTEFADTRRSSATSRLSNESR
jgi:predicted site-specific integrase-resolvase